MIENSHRLFVVCGVVALFACGDFESRGAETDVSGTVMVHDFSAVGGTAEGSIDNGYVVTLVDDPTFGCTSTPSGSYLTVVIGGVDSTGTIDAAGNVSFNDVDDPSQTSEGAETGTVEITAVDAEDVPRARVEGEIDAAGGDSGVVGTFSIPVC